MRKGLLLGLGTLFLHPAFSLAQPVLPDLSNVAISKETQPAIKNETPVDLPRAKVSAVESTSSSEPPTLTDLPRAKVSAVNSASLIDIPSLSGMPANPRPVKEPASNLPRAKVSAIREDSTPAEPAASSENLVSTESPRKVTEPAAAPEKIPFPPRTSDKNAVQDPTSVPGDASVPAPMPSAPVTGPIPHGDKPSPIPTLTPPSTIVSDLHHADGWSNPGPAVLGGSSPSGLPRVWVQSEFLLWWTKGVPVTTPLLTAATSTTDPAAGSFASQNTAILLGAQTYGLGTRYGGRFTVGGFLDADSRLGAEASYLFIAPRSTTKVVGSDGNAINSPTLGLPYHDANTGLEAFAPLAVPGAQSGGAFLTLRNQLQGGELNFFTPLISRDNLRISGLIGGRYLYFQEGLDFGFGVQGQAAAGFPGSFSSIDHFKADNHFFGGQLGLRGEYRTGNVFVNTVGKIAMGSMNRNADVSGGFAAITPATPDTTFASQAGFYALPTNIGHHTETGIAFVPEVTCTIGYYITQNIQATIGYTFLYIDNVARPGTLIDHVINTTQSPGFSGAAAPPSGPPVPMFSFNRTDFWAQGVNLGLSLTW